MAYLTNEAATTPMTVTGLPAGNYIMTVTDANNLCDNTHPFTIADDFSVPTLTLGNIAITDNDTCNPGSFIGEADASAVNVVAGGSGNYTFEWARDATPGVVLFTGSVLTGVEGDTYILTVTDNETGCVAAALDVTIGETLPTIDPVASALTNNTVCDPVVAAANLFPDYNGAITFTPTATSGAPAGGFNFALTTAGASPIAFDGSTGGIYSDVAYLTNEAATTPMTVTGLPAGNYIMTVTDANNLCDNTHPFTIADDFSVPTLTLGNIAVTDNDTCNPGSFIGEADASAVNVVAGGSGNYTFEWARDATPGVVLFTGSVLTGVEGDTYILTVTDNETGCVAAALDVTIGETLPTIDPVASALTNNTVCDPVVAAANLFPDYNGAITFHPYCYFWCTCWWIQLRSYYRWCFSYRF